MIVGIHQPHFFPWLGYMNKIAQSDIFIIMDDVQLEDRSPMLRNKIMDQAGNTVFLNIPVEKKGYREKKMREIVLHNPLENMTRIKKTLDFNYKNTYFYEEVMKLLEPVFEKEYVHLINLEMDIIEIFMKVLEIKTPLIKMSSLPYDKSLKKNDLIVELVCRVDGDIYLSGNGARKYNQIESYREKGIELIYQAYLPIIYSQANSKEFVEKLSLIDMFFNCGIEESRRLFWKNVEECKRKQVFE